MVPWTRLRAEKPRARRRLCYNYDAWAPFYTGHSPEQIFRNVDMFRGTQVTTLMLSPNVGQSLIYPSAAGEMCHSRKLDAKTAADVRQGMGDMVDAAALGAARLWREKRIDAFSLLVHRAVSQGFETFASFRMNDVHMVTLEEGRGPYTDAFYREHPEWRVARRRGLNYAVPEVRRYRLAVLEELLRRYPFAGLELDFHRGVPFFPDADAQKSAPLMTQFVAEVREMTRRVAKETRRSIHLAARVPSSLAGCLRVGLDPPAWHARGCLDFLSVGHFLHLFFQLPIQEFKTALPGLPVYASLDYVAGGWMESGVFRSRDASAELYRGAAAAAYARGADANNLFNMFAPRANGPDPAGKDWSHAEPVEVLREIGDPLTLEGKPKLYLVDSKVEPFDQLALDVPAQLPRELQPGTPLEVKMTIGEKTPAPRKMRLRIVTRGFPAGAHIRVSINGADQGAAQKAPAAHFFPEPYDQIPPDAAHCADFRVRGSDVKYGVNAISLRSSHAIMIRGIELAVT